MDVKELIGWHWWVSQNSRFTGTELRSQVWIVLPIVSQFHITGQQSWAFVVIPCDLCCVSEMDVFRTSEEWTAIIYQSEFWILCLSGNSRKLYTRTFALHFFILSLSFCGLITEFHKKLFWDNYFRNFFLYRMEDKGEVKCIKFSLGNKILAVQRTLKSVVRNLHPADGELELEIF